MRKSINLLVFVTFAALASAAGCEDEPEPAGLAGSGGRGGAGMGGGGAGGGGAGMTGNHQTTRTSTASIPAAPSAPVSITSTMSGGEFSVTLPPEAQRELVSLAGGAVEVKVTDLAMSDLSMLPASEQASINSNSGVTAILVFDVTRVGGAGGAGGMSGASKRFPSLATGSLTFSVKNNSGKRCSPGVADLVQIFGTTSTKLSSTVVFDDAMPDQNISGDSQDVVYSVLHFVFCFECPRTSTGSTGSGG